MNYVSGIMINIGYITGGCFSTWDHSHKVYGVQIITIMTV